MSRSGSKAGSKSGSTSREVLVAWWAVNWNNSKAIQELGSEDYLHSQYSELKRLGRAEGKALLSENLNFAVTPYFGLLPNTIPNIA